MGNQVMRKHDPIAFWAQTVEESFNFYRVCRFDPAQPVGKAHNVGINNHAGCNIISISKYDIGRLPAHSRQLVQLFKLLRHFALMFFYEFFAAGLYIFGFVSEKTRRFNQIFDISDRGQAHAFRIWKPPEQFRGHKVNPYVGTLGRENGRN